MIKLKSLKRNTNCSTQLKWHFFVIYYLNIDGVDGDIVSLEDDMRYYI